MDDLTHDQLKCKQSSGPTTKEEWWDLVYSEWNDLVKIMYKYLNIARLKDDAGIDPEFADKQVWVQVQKDKDQKNWKKLLYYFQRTWNDAPDCREIHYNSGWSTLCDLCSEAWVFQEENEDEQ